ncbi:MAG: TIGR04086 family membrane protein [Oscillospiraceae bacterium]|nr:TIGR04086 family membrane protein [Oscillospiraceae bacterium]
MKTSKQLAKEITVALIINAAVCAAISAVTAALITSGKIQESGKAIGELAAIFVSSLAAAFTVSKKRGKSPLTLSLMFAAAQTTIIAALTICTSHSTLTKGTLLPMTALTLIGAAIGGMLTGVRRKRHTSR